VSFFACKTWSAGFKTSGVHAGLTMGPLSRHRVQSTVVGPFCEKLSSIYDDPAGQFPRAFGSESIFIYLYRTVSDCPTKYLVKFKSRNVSTTWNYDKLYRYKACTHRKLAGSVLRWSHDERTDKSVMKYSIIKFTTVMTLNLAI